MSHFAGYLRKQVVDSEFISPVERSIQCRTLLALTRNTALNVEQRQDSRFWLAAVSLPTWSASIMVDRREHGLGAVAGDPLFVEAKEIPLIEASVTKVFEALSAGSIGKLAQTRGMFCAVTWAASCGRLVIATDRLANRSLYYKFERDRFLFATSLRLLRQMTQEHEVVDEQGLAEHLFFGQSLGERTVLGGVKVLMPGQALILERDAPPLTRVYADYTDTVRAALSYDEAESRLHQCFSIAVRRRLSAGRQEAFLSGGLDSRAVVAELIDQGRAIDTFCTAYRDSTDDIVSEQVAAALGTRHVSWHRTPAERVLVALDPFAVYARDHFPSANGPGPRKLWSGDGGSVTLGHVYMSAASIETAAGPLNADQVRKLFPALRTRPTRQISRQLTTHFSELATAGAMAELSKCQAAAPDRRLFHFYMRNDQARHLYHHLDSIDLTQVELLTPFFDADFVTLVSSLPTAWFLDHKIYNSWITRFHCGAGNIYWQSYPGHLPSPHARPPTASDQWRAEWYSTRAVRSAYSELAATLCARRDRLPFNYASKSVLQICRLLNMAGVTSYNYEISHARNMMNILGDA